MRARPFVRGLSSGIFRFMRLLIVFCAVSIATFSQAPRTANPNSNSVPTGFSVPARFAQMMSHKLPRSLQRRLWQRVQTTSSRTAVTASNLQPNLTVQSNSIFLEAGTYPTGAGTAVAVADINRDGKADLLLSDGSGVGVLLGNGDGTFQTEVSYSSGGSSPAAFAVGDVNGDANLDIVAANSDGTLGVLLGNGDGTFRTVVTYASGGSAANSIAIGDLNGDGRADLIVGNGGVGVLLGNGDGTFQPVLSYDTTGQTRSVAVADVNEDGKLDVVIAACETDNPCRTDSTGAAGVLVGNGDGTLQSVVFYSSGGLDADYVATSDVNGDGKPDLIVANQVSNNFLNFDWEPFTTGSVGVLLGNGDGTFQSATVYSVRGHTPGSLAVTDVNGDGKPDVLVVDSCASADPCSDIGGVDVFLNTGDGTFYGPATFDTAGVNARSIAIADVDGDGKVDVLVANNSTVAVMLGVGDGTFLAARTYDSAGYDADSVAIADVNGDGRPDLVIMNWCSPGIPFDDTCGGGGSFVGVLLGKGDGTFNPPVGYGSGGEYGLSVAVADVNGDGNPDLLVANSCSDKFCLGDLTGRVGVLLGNGDGTFQKAVSYLSGGNGASSIVVGDVNSDGNPDLLVATDSGVSVLLGNGDGTFQPAVVFGSGGNGPDSVAVADVNGDGKLDVLVTNSESGGVGVLLGNGDGSFAPAVNYSGGGTAIGVADVNSDGKPDIVLANDGVAVLLGNGDGTFQAAIPTTVAQGNGAAANQIAVADFDGDGKLDVASAGGDFLLLGNGDGTFGAPIILGAGPSPLFAGSGGGSGIAVGDFNRDQKPDIATGAGGVNVLLNIGHHLSATATQIVSSLNPSVVRQLITLTGSVTSSNSGVISGTVTFYNGASSLGASPVNNGVALLQVSSLAIGSHTITASYGGDSNFASSTSSPFAQVVNEATSATVLSSSVNPAIFGQSLTLSAAVTAQYGGAATGTITFYDGNTVLGTSTIVANSASLGGVSLPAGSHVVTAAYSGDGNVLPSTSAPLTATVNQAGATTTLTSNVNPVRLNSSVTYTALVISQFGGAVTGTVTFKDGTTSTIVSLVAGNAVLTRSYSTAGTHYVTATYSGDTNNAGGSSAMLTEYAEKLPVASQTMVTSSGSPSFINQPVTFTASVASPYGRIPNGETIMFYDGTVVIGKGITSNGLATLMISSLTPQKHTIKARYLGDSTFKQSSGTMTQVVNLYSSTTALGAAPNPSIRGQAVTLTAVVSSSAPGGPTGTVTFKNGTKTLGTGTLNSGTAILKTQSLPLGMLTLSAIYSGDTQSAKSVGTTREVVMEMRPPYPRFLIGRR